MWRAPADIIITVVSGVTTAQVWKAAEARGNVIQVASENIVINLSVCSDTIVIVVISAIIISGVTCQATEVEHDRAPERSLAVAVTPPSSGRASSSIKCRKPQPVYNRVCLLQVC